MSIHWDSELVSIFLRNFVFSVTLLLYNNIQFLKNKKKIPMLAPETIYLKHVLSVEKHPAQSRYSGTANAQKDE